MDSDKTSCRHCGGLLTGQTGSISAPSVIQDDPSNLTCRWEIALTDTSKIIHLAFNNSGGRHPSIAAQSSCMSDWLGIVDVAAETVSRFCHRDVPESVLLSSSTAEVVLWSSNSADFEITYQSLDRCEPGYSRTVSELLCVGKCSICTDAW